MLESTQKRPGDPFRSQRSAGLGAAGAQGTSSRKVTGLPLGQSGPFGLCPGQRDSSQALGLGAETSIHPAQQIRVRHCVCVCWGGGVLPPAASPQVASNATNVRSHRFRGAAPGSHGRLCGACPFWARWTCVPPPSAHGA